VAVATLLLGLLPMAVAPWLSLRVNVYQLPGSAMMRFLLAPITIAVIWALNRLVPNFSRYGNFAFAGAAVMQVITLSMLLYVASQSLTEQVLTRLESNAEAIPQSLGVGAWLLLGLSACFLVYCGLQLTKKTTKKMNEENQQQVNVNAFAHTR